MGKKEQTTRPVSPGLRLAGDIGLVAARPGSLDRRFAAVLIVGAATGLLLGLAFGGDQPVDWLLLGSFVVWQPVIEELLFRGVLQGALRRTRAGPRGLAGLTIANVATSTAFVLVHLIEQPAPWAVAVFIPSLLFGYFRDRTGSVLPGLLLHAVFNLSFFAHRAAMPWLPSGP